VAARQPKSGSTQDKPSAKPKKRTHVMASVRLDVASYAKVSAAAALAGVDKSTYMSRAITEALKGIVVFDRNDKSSARVDLADSDNGEDRQDEAA
jgi:hypothetical protein